MAKGGARKGAGRPKGSRQKPRMTDFISPDELRQVAANLLAKANDGDVKAQTYILDQSLGKAPQSMDLTSDGEKFSFIINEGNPDKPVESPRESEEADRGPESE